MKEKIQKILDETDADVVINGDRPWDIQVKDPRLYRRVMIGGSVALGEAYMDGWWECEALDEFFRRILSAGVDREISSWTGLWDRIKAAVLNLQDESRAYDIGEFHYDIGNDLYRRMLDRRMVYSCAYWRHADNLNEAQEAKLDLVCRKIGLEPGMRVLDIGCGWGSFVAYAAENYGVEAVGITVSEEQVALARERCQELPVEIRLQDYRELDETYDRVVSLGMFEHVGYKNYETYMKVVRQCLTEEGLFLLHTIGGNRSRTTTDPWVNKYIFPNGMIPSARQITGAMEGVFVMEDWHNFGTYYDLTLMAWYENVVDTWDELKATYGKRFYRMWTYYLQMAAGSFRARTNQVWQLVLSRDGISGGYESVR